MNARPIDANALERDMREYADITHGCGHTELANGILKGMGRINYAPTLTLNTMRDAIYQDAVAHGLWEDYYIGLSVDLLDECHELIYDEVGELDNAIEDWANGHGIERFAEELAEVVIMCFSVAGKLDIDIDEAIRNKMEVNKQRPWKHGKAGDV